MIKIEIETDEVRKLEGVSAKTNKAYSLRIQFGYAFIVGPDGKPNKYPEKFEFFLDKEQAPYPAGLYQLHPSAIGISDGRLSVTAALAPLKA
jgi:hypothetical protein